MWVTCIPFSTHIVLTCEIFPGVTLASLYCNHASREAFFQLCVEFADAVRRITGKSLQLRPFSVDGNLRVILMDGDVAQAQGLGDWLSQYNSPLLNGINTRDPLELLLYILKNCSIHFERCVHAKAETYTIPLIRIKEDWWATCLCTEKHHQAPQSFHGFTHGCWDRGMAWLLPFGIPT